MQITDDSQLIVLHEMFNGQQACSLKYMLADEPLNSIMGAGLFISSYCRQCQIAAPTSWGFKAYSKEFEISPYASSIPLDENLLADKNGSYLIVSNGRYHSNLNYYWLRKLVESFGTDLVLINVEPALLIGHEKLQLTAQGQLAGIRRIYSDSAQRAPIPHTWPCCMFIRKSIARNVMDNNGIPAEFEDFKKLITRNISLSSIKVGGTLLDIGKPDGFLEFITKTLESPRLPRSFTNSKPANAKCYGSVHIGKNVHLGENVKLVGPVLICNNAQISNGVVVAKSVIGSGVEISDGRIVNNHLIFRAQNHQIIEFKQQINCVGHKKNISFRIWPRLSYARFFKRTADMIFAAGILILFAPVIAIIALIIKMTSRGPVFFGHRRQSLHGKEFRCLKFRSMIVGADDLQRKLRIKNEVDGPQFKMEDDPRVTPIGKFLRDTYLDEIPQFFNVLIGKMSLIGPRPSPEAENSLCAYWRDARLSVRPGITGLWQVCRTRKLGNDFQEWVHYDSEYVRQLSLKLDLWIFWKTIKYLMRAFLRQF